MPLMIIYLLSVLMLIVKTSSSSIVPHILPNEFLSAPTLPDPHSLGQLSGRIEDRNTLQDKPRVVIGYLSAADWAFIEFLCMTHASWRYLVSLADLVNVRLDLLVLSDPRWAAPLSEVCSIIDLAAAAADNYMSFEQKTQKDQSQCFAVVYPTPPDAVWHGYPFINNVHFFADPLLVKFLTQRPGAYGYAMKTDFDTFLSPSFLHFFPETFTFGVQEYVILPSTANRLKRIAKDLELQHHGRHNLGPTWYGDVVTLLAVANLSIPIMHHIITQEFVQKPGGGVAQKWSAGEGWPEWSAGIAALYATELAANHLLRELQASEALDSHGDSSAKVSSVIHIHCRHGDNDFNKFDFFKHHYDDVDLANLDTSTVRGYATYLAASSWRALAAHGGHRQGKPAGRHTEL